MTAPLSQGSNTTFAAIVLAAGMSSRFEGGLKLTSMFRGQPLILHSLTSILTSGFEQVIVVTGHEAGKVQTVCEPLTRDRDDIAFAYNADYALGMGGSIAAGMKALDARVDGVFIFLGDMPLIDVSIIDALKEGFIGAGQSAPTSPLQDKKIFRPQHDGKPGHPVLFGSQFFNALTQLSGDDGARDILNTNKAALQAVEVQNPLVLYDVDRREDMLAAPHDEGGAAI